MGVIAPDKACKSSDQIYLEKAEEYFKSLGLKVKYGKYLFSDDEYCAASPKKRAEDLNDMFRNKEIKAIFTCKGGYMANGILPFIDYEAIKEDPKFFLGMSDITVLLCAIHKMTGLITFHAQDYIWFGKDEVTFYDKNEIIDKLFKGNQIMSPYGKREFLNFNEEKITGKVYGTNAVSLLMLVGTPYMPDLCDAILFLEELDANIVEWNSMLEHFHQMGVLTKAVVFGYIYHLQHVLKNKDSIVKELQKIVPTLPIIKTNDFGHFHANSIIPIGAFATLNKKDKSITFSNYLD